MRISGTRASAALLSAACVFVAAETTLAQGITTTPKPPSSPAATPPPPPKKPLKKKKPAVPTDGADPADTPPGAAEAQAEPPADPKAEPEPKPEPKTLQPKIDLHGGAWLFWYQPFNIPGEKPFLRMHFAHLNFDGSIGDFGLFFNANARDTKMREFYEGTAWLEEAYFYYKNPYITVKLGKVYSRLGLFWDNSFYGSVYFYDGLKLAPENGVSLEGSVGQEKGFRLGYYGQYFLVDGRTNGSFVGRDTISIPGARRRNQAVLRAEPAYFWAKDISLTVGLSGSYFQADMPEPVGPKDVFRMAGDLNLNLRAVSIWADFTRQIGESVSAYPILPTPANGTSPATAGRASGHNDYVLAGGEVHLWKFFARYNFSAVFYRDVGITELMHQPGIELRMNDYLQVLAEYARWSQRSDTAGVIKRFDNTLAVTMHGYF